MAGLLLSIDVGTTSCKAGTVTTAGVQVAQGTAPTPCRPSTQRSTKPATAGEEDLDAGPLPGASPDLVACRS